MLASFYLNSLARRMSDSANRKGLAFFATPHNGGDPKLLTLGSITSQIARSTGFEQNRDVLETLKDDSIFSGILQEHV